MDWGHTSFGYRLRSVRLIRNLSERQVATASGIPRSTLRDWGTRMNMPPDRRKQAEIIAKLLNVDVEWLMRGQGEAPERLLLPEYEDWCKQLGENWEYLNRKTVAMLAGLIRTAIDRARIVKGLPPLASKG